MTWTVVPELPVLDTPEAVSKTDKSITARLAIDKLINAKQYKFQVAHSEHGYVYYSWTESELISSSMCPVKGLLPNTTYVLKARVMDLETRTCSEWSAVSAYVRTFTEEEDAKRAGTVFEHALRLERERKEHLQSQISKLSKMLDENARSKAETTTMAKENMMTSRRVIDTTIHKLQSELSSHTEALQAIKIQRAADEQMITELLNEQESLRAAQSQQQDSVKYELEMQHLRDQLERNEASLQKRQQQVSDSHAQVTEYEATLHTKQEEIRQKEEEVERLMADCNRMVQEQADIAHAKQLELEDALLEAKNSLEQQLDINTYLREEVSRLREENHHLKNQIEELDSEIAPKLIRLEEENEELKRQLAARG